MAAVFEPHPGIGSDHLAGLRGCLARALRFLGSGAALANKAVTGRVSSSPMMVGGFTPFTRVVFVATGEGIETVLPDLLAAREPSRLVWAAHDPRTSCGNPLVDALMAAQPNAMIWDTSRHGHPDLVTLTRSAVQEIDAEAVVVVLTGAR